MGNAEEVTSGKFGFVIFILETGRTPYWQAHPSAHGKLFFTGSTTGGSHFAKSMDRLLCFCNAKGDA